MLREMKRLERGGGKEGGGDTPESSCDDALLSFAFFFVFHFLSLSLLVSILFPLRLSLFLVELEVSPFSLSV